MGLQAKGLAVQRGGRTLLRALDFEWHAGQALLLQGRNGSGKTSLLRVLAGLAEAAGGDLLWRGVPLAKQWDEWRAGLLFVGHAPALKDDLLAWENLDYSARLGGQACGERAALAALGALGLGAQARRPARLLSQGQRKRLSLARLFLPSQGGQRLLLDEPFDALDPSAVATLKSRLEALLAAGSRLIYTTHQPQALQGLPTQLLDLDARRGA